MEKQKSFLYVQNIKGDTIYSSSRALKSAELLKILDTEIVHKVAAKINGIPLHRNSLFLECRVDSPLSP